MGLGSSMVYAAQIIRSGMGGSGSIDTSGIEKSLGAIASNIGKLADNVEHVSNSLDRGFDKIAKPLAESVGIQFNELELAKVELIKNLEQEILDYIQKCQENGIVLDISKVKLDFQAYSYSHLKKSVEKYIELITFKSFTDETKYKETQEYVQEEFDKIIREMPPFLKKYPEYNYGHFFIDRIAYGLYERDKWGARICSKGYRPFSPQTYQFYDYKGNFHNLESDVVFGVDGNELYDEDREYLINYEPDTKSGLYTFDSKYAWENPKKYLGYREELSIFENGRLRSREHLVWFDWKNDFQKYGSIVVPNYYWLPIIQYYYDHSEYELRKEFRNTLGDANKGYGINYSDFIKFLKNKGIIDIEQKLKSGELDYAYLFQVIDPIGDIIKRISLNLANEDIFKEKYLVYLQDTINEYSNILKELKLQAIESMQRNTLNNPNEIKHEELKKNVYKVKVRKIKKYK